MRHIIFLCIPITFLIVQIIIELTMSRQALAVLHSEGGPHEWIQFFLLVGAFFTSMYILFLKPWQLSLILGGWVGLAALGSLYVAGEEVSWGQHIMHWSTPEYWQNLNDQGETNLHNISSWLDQKPRLILQIGVLIGGLFIPLLQKFKEDVLPEQFRILYPNIDFVPVTVIALVVNMSDKLAEQLDLVLFERASEVEELYLFYFVLVYLVMLLQRVRCKLQNQT